MKALALLPPLLILSAGCAAPATVEDLAFPPFEPLPLDPAVEARVDQLLAELTTEEKLTQVHGTSLVPDGDGFWPVAGVDRLGVPRMRMVDGPKGLGGSGQHTAFPVAMARGATWDPDLERRVGEAMGAEASAAGADVLLAPTINLLRHPAWGRAQETYGEDPFLLGALGVAFVQGLQTHVMASVKHFALNSIEDTRFDVNVTADDRTMQEVYLPHFRKVVREANVASVMSAYNKVNGLYCGENPVLLTEILREQWGFQGFVESDWVFGTRSTVPSIQAGLDLEMPVQNYYGDDLASAVGSGEVGMDVLDGAVRRVLRRKLEYGLEAPDRPDRSVIAGPEHAALAREAAAASTVLLRNDGLLPLDPVGTGTVALVGALSSANNLGDEGSSAVRPPYVVTVLDGLVDVLGDDAVVHIPTDAPDETDLQAVAEADVAVVVVGLTALDEGEFLFGDEGGDRERLGLDPVQDALVEAVLAANDRVIVVLRGGSALELADWADEVPALVMAWYGGMEGGHGLADVLFGVVDASGRLPVGFPRAAADLVVFEGDSLEVAYDLLHGYRRNADLGLTSRFAFGFGLSYTTFELGAPAVQVEGEGVEGTAKVRVNVRNTGSRDGVQVVQVYASLPEGPWSRPDTLVGFARVQLAAGASEDVTVVIPATEFGAWDPARGWILPVGEHQLRVGTSAEALSEPLAVTWVD